MGRGGFVRVAGGGVAVFGGSGVSARAAYCSLLERKELRERERGKAAAAARSVKFLLYYTTNEQAEDPRSMTGRRT